MTLNVMTNLAEVDEWQKPERINFLGMGLIGSLAGGTMGGILALDPIFIPAVFGTPFLLGHMSYLVSVSKAKSKFLGRVLDNLNMDGRTSQKTLRKAMKDNKYMKLSNGEVAIIDAPNMLVENDDIYKMSGGVLLKINPPSKESVWDNHLFTACSLYGIYDTESMTREAVSG